MRKHSLKCILTALTIAMALSVFEGMQMSVVAAEEVSMPKISTSQLTSAVVKLDRSVGVAIQQRREKEIADELAAKEQMEAERRAAEEARKKAEETKKAAEAAKKSNAKAAKTKETKTPEKTSSSISANSSVGQNAVAAARSCIGTRYGACKFGTTFDCSGLTQYAYSKAGVSLCHSSCGQYASCKKIASSQLQVGDLVFWGNSGNVNHVGIYSGSGKVIDASPNGVVERSIYSTVSQQIIGYGRP
ncbi:MAG: C40 family peptidase [Oscillospiraceae bacterium]|nr:C40 family peptidase [Oscillospiraceae bacterium]